MSMSSKTFAFIGWAALLAVQVICAADVSVWTVSPMKRVMRHDAPGKGRDVTLHAARGEWESFQVVLTGSSAALSVCSIEMTPLKNATGHVLPAPKVYFEHYVRVSKSTPRAPLPPGDYPDALLPL